MLYNFGQLRQYTCQLAGIQNSNPIQTYDLDTTTFPTLDMGNNMLNDAIREVTSGYPYQFLEMSKSYQFFHVISGVSSLSVYSSSGSTHLPFSGSITPYPPDVLNYAWNAQAPVTEVNNNFSGLAFTGIDVSGNSATGISSSGSITTANWSGVGFVYQLDQDLDKFLAPAIVIANSTANNTAYGIVAPAQDYEDIVRLIPIGVIQASGTPSMFFEAPGMNPTNGKAIQFYPFPTPSYSGQTFIANYLKKHVDLVNDSDVQTVVPEQWQNVIIQAFLEKIQSIRTPDRVADIQATKTNLINKMKVWDFNQPSKMRRWRDFNYNSSVSSAYDNSTWFHLSDNDGR